MPSPDASVKGDELDRASAVLRAFATAMSRWELDCAAQARQHPLEQMDAGDAHEVSENWRAACLAIFDRYCTDRPRGNHRPSVAHFVDPSDYAPDRFQIERVEFDTSPRIHGYTTQGPRGRFRFTLVKKKDGWRVDQREVWHDGCWVYTEL